MALKKKISKKEYEKLPDHLKSEYKADGEDYSLDVEGEEDASALLRAKEYEKEARKTAERKLKEVEEKLEALEEKNNAGEKDIGKINEKWQGKLDKQKNEYEQKLSVLTNGASKLLVDNTANDLANKLAGKNAKILLPHIKMRLQADMSGDAFKTVVLGPDGKATDLSLEKLSEEFVANPEFSSIIIGSKASGGAGGGGGATKTGFKPDNNQQKPPDLSAIKPTALVELLDGNGA